MVIASFVCKRSRVPLLFDVGLGRRAQPGVWWFPFALRLARGFLLRQLSSLAFENLHQFSQQQLLLLMRGLGRLRFLTPANCDALLQHFRIDCSSDQQRRQVQDGEGNAWVDHGWTPHRSAMLLGALALCDVGPAHRASTAVLMQLLQHVEDALEQHAGAAEAAAGGSVAKRTQCLGVAALVEAAYAICYFQLQGGITERAQERTPSICPMQIYNVNVNACKISI